jgi:hypothetical protein
LAIEGLVVTKFGEGYYMKTSSEAAQKVLEAITANGKEYFWGT